MTVAPSLVMVVAAPVPVAKMPVMLTVLLAPTFLLAKVACALAVLSDSPLGSATAGVSPDTDVVVEPS